MILYEKLYEREGNDSWLKDYIVIHKNMMGIYLEHKVHHTGWGGDIKESYSIDLDEDDLNESQEKINNHLINHCLEDDFSINLIELLNKE